MFIALNCITLAMERPNIPPDSTERVFLGTANYVFTVVFAIEMFVKVKFDYTLLHFFLLFSSLDLIATHVRRSRFDLSFPASLPRFSTIKLSTIRRNQVVAAGMFYGTEPYFKSGWNIMDGLLVVVSIIDLLMSLISESSPKIFGILRVSKRTYFKHFVLVNITGSRTRSKSCTKITFVDAHLKRINN